MGKLHDEAVNNVYRSLKPFEQDPDVRWDYVGKEVDYWRTPETSDCEDDLMYTQKGDFDILGLDYENNEAYLVEVKTNPSSASKGYRQLKKAEEHFQALGWDTIPCLLMNTESEMKRPENRQYASD